MRSYVQKQNVPLFFEQCVCTVFIDTEDSTAIIAVYLDFFHQQPCYIFSLSSCHSPWFPSFHSWFGIRNLQDHVQLSKQAIWFRSHPHLASQTMFIRSCFHNHQYCQPLPHLRSVSSHSPLSRHCLRNRHWIKKNSQTIGQSLICLSFPK